MSDFVGVEGGLGGGGGGRGGVEGGRRPHLIVMVGLPARGKTYIAKKLARWYWGAQLLEDWWDMLAYSESGSIIDTIATCFNKCPVCSEHRYLWPGTSAGRV